MSSESLAALRRTAGPDLAKLAEQHIQHDLNDADRQTLTTAASRLSTNALVGSLVGLGLGTYLAFRLRANRTRMYQAFRAADKPTHVRFADGREEAIPDITPLLKPSTLGDIATYTFFAAGGLLLGGEGGLLTGTWSARRSIEKDPESRKRIEDAFKRFRADVLRKQIEDLERGQGSVLEL